MTDAVFDEVGFFHNGKAIGYIDGQYCLIDSNGQIIKKYDVDHIRLNDALEYGDVVCAYNGIVNDRAPVMDGGEYFLMKSDGTILTRDYKHTIMMDYDKTNFVPEKDINTFQLYPSNEEKVTLNESFGKSFNKEWIKYNNIKMGFNIKFSLDTGEEINYNIFNPNDTFKEWEFLLNYLYDVIYF